MPECESNVVQSGLSGGFRAPTNLSRRSDHRYKVLTNKSYFTSGAFGCNGSGGLKPDSLRTECETHCVYSIAGMNTGGHVGNVPVR